MIKLRRKTTETDITIGLEIGTGLSTVATTEPFLDHMVLPHLAVRETSLGE